MNNYKQGTKNRNKCNKIIPAPPEELLHLLNNIAMDTHY